MQEAKTTKSPDAKAIAAHLAADVKGKSMDTKTEGTKTIAIKVIPELRDFLDILSEEERKGLEADIIEHGGAREPILIWKEEGAIVDGHNRHAICTAHNLPFKTEEKSFKDIEAVKQWMLRNQLNRRNLSPVRLTYFRGMLYNQMKQDPKQARTPTGGKTTAETLGEQFGVNEKTIRRDGAVASAIEAVGRVHKLTSVKEKLEKITAKNGEGFKKEELEEIGKVADPQVQEEAVKELTKIKAAEVAKKVQAKVQAQPIKEKAKEVEKKAPFGVVFCKPAFDALSFDVKTEVRPPMAENAVCYMAVPDEELSKGMALVSRWGLEYQGSIVVTMDDAYEGVFADVKHVFMIVATRGTKVFKGKAVGSIIPKNGNPEEQMIKVIEAYHPSEKRLDMRRDRTAKGWEKL